MKLRSTLARFEQELKMRLRGSNFSQRALNAFFTSAPAGIVILDSKLRIVKANVTMAEMIGYPLKEIIGQTVRQAVPLLSDKVEPILLQTISAGTAMLNVSITGETPKSPGTIRQWMASIFPICPEAKGGGHIGAIIVEVTEEVHFEKLRKSEALLAEAEQIGHLGCWENDLVTGDNVWSANLCRLVGVDPTKTKLSEELFWKLLHPDDREAVRTVIEGGMKDAQDYEYQSRLILPGGSERTFYTYGKPVLGLGKQVIKRVGLTQDITARVEVERALLESEERYRDLVESSHDLICTHDLDGRVLSMNGLPARLLGYSREELIGCRIPDYLTPEARDQFEEYIERIKKDGFANGLMVLVTKSGEQRTWEFQNTLRTEGVPTPIVRGMAHDVTERIATQKALHESTARLQALVSSIDEIAFEFSVDGTFLEIWTADESLLFHPRKQLLGHRISDVMGESFAPLYRDVFRRVLETGKGEDLEYPLQSEGEERWFLCRVTPIAAEDGTYKSICMLARDITARKQTEKSLSLFRALIDKSNDAIEVVDPGSHRFIDVNQKACTDFGYTREEILRMSVYDIDPTVDQTSYNIVIEALNRSGSFIKEGIHRRKDGSTFPVEVSINLVRVDKNYIVTVVRDITERKRTQDALHDSEARLRLATQAGKMYAFEWDCATNEIVRSPECREILGPVERTRLTRQEILAAIHPEDRKGLDVSSLTPRNAISNLRYRIIRRDGTLIWVEKTARAFFDEHGKMLRIIGMIADITDRKQAEDALRVLSAKLINLQDEERRRIAIELHEGLAQDLTGLKLSLGHLKRLTRKNRTGITDVVNESDRLIDELLEQVRKLSYSLHPQLLETVGLPSAVTSYAQSFSIRSGIEVKLRIDIPKSESRLPGQFEITLFRLVQECLTNIHRHSTSKVANVHLSLESERLILEVSDQGQGLARASESGVITNAVEGVGIASMRERVEQLRGTIAIDSKAGQGVTVRVVLPVSSEVAMKMCDKKSKSA